MLVSVEGLQQGAFETVMSMLPRKGGNHSNFLWVGC